MDNAYQAVGFHFAVHFSAGDGGSVDIRFQSVAGLDSTIDIETIKEGGENRFEHVIPTKKIRTARNEKRTIGAREFSCIQLAQKNL
jgi:hypothetical protein